MTPRTLVSIDLRFITEESAEGMIDRVKEAVATIVGREALEEFRAKKLPIESRKP